MAYSLLAHLYPYIKGSQEDVATFSLQYLLSQSASLNRTFTRLKKNNGTGLLFVCPMVRRTSLWAKLNELCADMSIEKVNDYCVTVDGVKMAIITWSEIIELLKQVASSVDIAFSADIQQLEGYCNRLDSDAFIPFTAEDLSANVAKMEERYYMVLDEVMDLLMADNSIKTSKKGTKATAYRKGYTRSLIIDDYAISMNYDRDLWKNPASVETPFWVAIRRGDWEQTAEIRERFNVIPKQKKESFWNMIFLAIEPLQNVTLSEVCEDIKLQILQYIDMVR